MDETKCFELLGRKQQQLDQLNAEYDNLLRVLARVQNGEIQPSQLQISLVTRSWQFAITETAKEE